MTLQYKDIASNEVKYVNEENDPIRLLEQQNADLLLDNVLKEAQLQDAEQAQADLVLQLVEKGVL